MVPTKPKPNFGGKKVKKVSVGSGLVLITPDFSEKTGAYFSVGGNVGMAFFLVGGICFDGCRFPSLDLFKLSWNSSELLVEIPWFKLESPLANRK